MPSKSLHVSAKIKNATDTPIDLMDKYHIATVKNGLMY